MRKVIFLVVVLISVLFLNSCTDISENLIEKENGLQLIDKRDIGEDDEDDQI